MRRKYISIITAAALLAGCSSEEIYDTSISLEEGSLLVQVENGHHETRAGFTDDKKDNFFWSKHDEIAVSKPGNKGLYRFYLAGGEGTPHGTFMGITTDEKIGNYIVYPYSAASIEENGQLKYTLPASYTYTSVESDFHSVAPGKGNSFNPVMAGKIESVPNSGSVAKLSQLGGVFCVKINKMPGSEGVFTLKTDKGIQGDFVLNLSDKKPSLKAVESDGSNNKVAIHYSGAAEGQPAIFYVPVPVATTDYAGVRVELAPKKDASDSNTYFASCGDFHVNEGSIWGLDVETTTKLEQEKTLETVTQQLSDKNKANEKVTVAIKGTVSDATIEVPVPTETTEQPVEKKIAINEVADNATVTLKEPETQEANKKTQEVTLAIPHKKETTVSSQDSKAPSVNVTMPNSTVKLEASSGTATFKEVNAETKTEKTTQGKVDDKVVGLEISKGVTVHKLVVSTGNIHVKSGGEIKSIELAPAAQTSFVSSRAEGDTRVYLITEEGAKVPPVLPTGISRKLVGVAKLKEAIAQNSNGENPYVLEEDLDLRGKKVIIPQGKAFKLDLNGHTLTADNSETGNIMVQGTFTLLDTKRQGKVLATAAYSDKYAKGMITVDGGDFILESGILEAKCDNPADGQNAIKVLNKGKVQINDGTIQTGWAALCAEATAGTIIIDKGSFTSTNGTVLDLKGGTTTINGGSFVAEPTAEYIVKAEAGSLQVKQGTFKGKIAPVIQYVYPESPVSSPIQILGGNFDDPAALCYAKTTEPIVTLKEDYTWHNQVLISGGILNLNQKTLILDRQNKAQLRITTSNGLVVRNGKITGSYYNLMDPNFSVYKEASLKFDGVTMKTDGIAIAVNGEAKSVDVINSSIDAGNYALKIFMSGNKLMDVVATINKSTLSGRSAVCYQAQGALNIINKSTITGQAQGVIFYGGIFTLNNSTINMDYAKLTEGERNYYKYLESVAWESFEDAPAAGLVVGSNFGGALSVCSQVNLLNEVKINNLSPTITDFRSVYIYANQVERKVTYVDSKATATYYNQPWFVGREVWVNGERANKDISAGGEGLEGLPTQP